MIDVLLSHVNVTKLSTEHDPQSNKKKLFKKTEKKNRKKRTTFFNPETDPDPDRKPTFQQKKQSRSRPTAKSQSLRAL
jgi:hypothetical protein